MSDATALRKLADDLRLEANRRDVDRKVKAGHALRAATGLRLLKASLEVRK